MQRITRSLLGKLFLLAGLFPVLSAGAEAHVLLIQPNGGEVLAVGSVYQIQWTIAISHNLQNWDLTYSTTGLAGPGTIVIGESAARRYFGDADPIGATVTVDNDKMGGDYVITGVVQDMSEFSHVGFDFMTASPPAHSE